MSKFVISSSGIMNLRRTDNMGIYSFRISHSLPRNILLLFFSNHVGPIFDNEDRTLALEVFPAAYLEMQGDMV